MATPRCEVCHELASERFALKEPEQWTCARCFQLDTGMTPAQAQHAALEAKVALLASALADAAEHMERARLILQERDGGNWGMLDTAIHRALLARIDSLTP